MESATNGQVKAEVKDIFRNVSVIALKQWLKVQKKPHSSRNTEEHFDLLSSLVEREALTLDHLREAALGFEENGAKEIFFCTAPSSFNRKDDFLAHLERLGIKYSEERVSAFKTPPVPALGYVTWEEHIGGPQIRLKYSETHERVTLDREVQQVSVERRTKIFVLIHEVNTGFTQLRYDRPSDVHPHKDSRGRSNKKQYHRYYRDLAKKILGAPCGGMHDLGDAMECLATADPRVFRIPREDVRTSFNSRQGYRALNPEADVRDDPAHQAAAGVDGKNWVYELLEGYYLPGVCDGNQLHRELFMGLNWFEGKIWFAADCLPEEVDYAICQIRSLCGFPS